MLTFDETMLNVTCPAGKFDAALNFLGGNNQIFSFMGERIYASLYKMVREDDHSRLESATARCGGMESSAVEECIHIVNDQGGYDTFMVTVRKNEQEEYYIEFVNITEYEKKMRFFAERHKKARDYLTLIGEMLFEYHPDTNIFKLYWINHEQTVIIVEKDFDEWKQDMITKSRVEGEDLLTFELFFDSVKNCDFCESYKFHGSILTDGIRVDSYKVKPLERIYSGKGEVIGTWSTTNELTGDPIENYMEDTCMDPLTRLLNKKAITTYAENAVLHAGDGNVAIAVMDIDNFKNVNDMYGHMFGDRVIAAVANLIKKAVGDKGVAGRMGGDEFMIVIEDCKNELELRNILRCIKINMSGIYQGRMGNNKLSCSIGASRYGRDSKEYKELFKIADKALYIAKQKGKNRYIIYEVELHGQFVLNKNNSDMVDIRDSIYAEKDLFHVNKLLSEAIIYGEERLTALFEKTVDTLMVDRVYMYYGSQPELRCISTKAEDKAVINPEILQNEKYLEQFKDDMLIYNNINTIEYSIPEAYKMISDAGICSTMQHILRDLDGNIAGLICVDMCRKHVSFPKVATQLFDNMSEVINGIMLREDSKS